jgi:hypothetical protein
VQTHAFDTSDKHNAEIAASGAHEERSRLRAPLVFSAVLHAIIFSAFVVILGLAASPNDIPLVIPVDIVQLGKETAAPVQPTAAAVPQQQAAPPSSPDAKPVDVLSARKKDPPDSLEVKLRELAQLRQPRVDTHLSKKGEGLARLSAARQDAVLGPEATIKDFLRDQIEHHWSLDLPTLHGRNISVSIRLGITKAGVITKAEAVNSPGLGLDPVYDEIAASARNAALLSSPLTLPPGHYGESMDLIVTLNTRDALR